MFDFGLARQLSGPNGKCYGRTGTVRYMAPEVLVPPILTDDEIAAEYKTLTVREKKRKERAYTYSVDVFSYGILLWQIITLRPPYENELSSYVNPNKSPQVNGKRPPLKYVVDYGPGVKDLLQQCWCANPKERLTFQQIGIKLQSIVSEMTTSTIASSSTEDNDLSSSSTRTRKTWRNNRDDQENKTTRNKKNNIENDCKK